MIYLKISKIFNFLFIFFLALALIFPYDLGETEAASDNLNKTAEYFIGQDAVVHPSGELVSLPSFTINIPEGSPIVTSAIIEINGVSYNDSAAFNQEIMADLQRDAQPPSADPNYIFNYTLGGTNSKPRPFTLKYDALKNNLGGAGAMSDIVAANTNYLYRLYLKNSVSSGVSAFSIASAKLILTYYNSTAVGTNLLKTNKFFVLQETGNKADGAEASADFTITIPEQSPAIQSVFIEVSGIAKASGAGIGTASVSVTDQGGMNYANYSLDLGGAGNISKFLVRHDASAAIFSADFPGSKTYTLRLKSEGFSVNLWNAKLIVTYKYTENVGGLPISGYVISSTIDTGVAKGAAYNSIIWKGNLNGGKVQMQLATSAFETGPWVFKGPDCSSATFYEPAADTPIEIMCATDIDHSNKQYFRYKVILCSGDCISPGLSNPEVTGVVVNWAE